MSKFFYQSKEVHYTNLHQHSSYSNLGMLDAYWTPNQIIDRCIETNASWVALTDHGSVSWHIKLIRGCKKKDIKPLCGCEMYVVDSLQNLKEVRDKIKIKTSDETMSDENQEYKEDEKAKARQKFHFNVFAKNQQWLYDLWKLVSTSWTEGFYFKPSIDWDLLKEKRENLWFWTACEIGPLWRLLDHYQYKIKLEKDKLLTELIDPYDSKQEKIEVLKKEIKKLREERKELDKAKKLTKDTEAIFLEKIKSKKLKIHWIEEEYNKLVEEVEEKRKDEISKITEKHLKDARDSLRERLLELKGYFWDNLYVEVIPEKHKRARWKYLLSYEVAKELDVLVVCANDSHAPRKEDTEYQDLLYTYNLHRSDKEVSFLDEDRSRYTPWLFYIHSAEEMFKRMKDTFPEISEDEIIQMMNNTETIVNSIEIVKEPSVPAVAFEVLSDKEGERGTNLYRLMQETLHKGWAFRELDNLEPEVKKVYLARVKRELEIILYKGYIDYFMIMADIMDWCDNWRPYIENFERWYNLNWAADKYKEFESKEALYEHLKNLWMFEYRESIWTWIARWSAGWSLVAYLMRITNIDPMPGDLLFERFIDYTRWDVYYTPNYSKYSKPKFLKEFSEENKNLLDELEKKYRPLIDEKIDELLEKDPWYDKLQILREFWLLDHNQQFSREKEYFYISIDKKIKWEIESSPENNVNSILWWIMWLTSQEPKGDYIVNLTDIPDIDSDFEDERRNEVYLYLQHRYWVVNSCRIATYTFLKAPSAIDLLSKIFDNEKREIVELKQKIEDYVKELGEVELKAKYFEEFFAWEWLPYLEKYPWLKYAKPLLGQVTAWWMHAAWMIVHNQPVSKYWAIYWNKDKDTGEMMTVICWDSVEAESMGLMKLDLLSLNTVTNVKRINKIVEERHWFKHHWQRIPWVFQDKKTKELVQRADNVGLFQLEWKIMTHLSKLVKPTEFEEIVFIAAWWRPGPLQDAMEYWEIKFWKKEPFYYDNEIYKSITERWWGKVIYQEDLMKMSKLMCWYDDKMVWYIRKLVSKVKREEIKALEPDFISRLKEHAWMSDEHAHRLWEALKNFWAYAFNKAHSEAYWLLAWIQAYYKANYPLEFYCWMLQTLKQVSWKVEWTEKDKVKNLLLDYKEHWFKLLSPDINKSETTFKIDKDFKTWNEYIRVWLDYIKGVWTKQAVEIVKKQPYEDYYDFLDKVEWRIVNSKVVQICKDMWLFNSIWWAPNINEKLVPEINYIEETIDISEKLLEIMEDIKNEKEETLTEEGDEEIIESKVIELYKLMWISEEKYPPTSIDDFWLKEVKKVMTKLKSKLKWLSGRIEKKIFWYEMLEDEYISKLDNVKSEIDTKLWNLEKDLKELHKKKDKRSGWLTIFEENKHNLFEDKYQNDLDILQKVNKLVYDELSISELSDLEWHSKLYIENLIIYVYLKDILKLVVDVITEVSNSLNLDRTCVIIKPDLKYVMKTCWILVNVDLKEYSSLVNDLNKFIPFKALNFSDELRYFTTIWVIMDKVILNDQLKEDWTVNYNKTKVRGSLMLWDTKKPLFINWHSYLKNKEGLDTLQDWDPVVIRFNISPWFTMIQTQEIVKADVLQRKILNREWLDVNEQKVVREWVGVKLEEVNLNKGQWNSQNLIQNWTTTVTQDFWKILIESFFKSKTLRENVTDYKVLEAQKIFKIDDRIKIKDTLSLENPKLMIEILKDIDINEDRKYLNNFEERYRNWERIWKKWWISDLWKINYVLFLTKWYNNSSLKWNRLWYLIPSDILIDIVEATKKEEFKWGKSSTTWMSCIWIYDLNTIKEKYTNIIGFKF